MPNKKTIWWQKPRRSETLLEVLLAIVVLIIGSATATSLILSAMKANAFNKDSLVALNLAQEGIEYMRNLRDTNWIRFSADRQGCWNSRPGVATCTVANLMIDTNAGSGYSLGDALSARHATKLDLSDGITAADENYRLKYFDLNTGVDSDGEDKDDSGGKAKEADDYDFIGSFYGAEASVDDTKFFRRIGVEYYTIGAGPGWALTGPGVLPQNADMMMVSSTVVWLDANVVHQINLKSALTRYK